MNRVHLQSKLRVLIGITAVWIILCGGITYASEADVKPESEVKIEAGAVKLESSSQQDKRDMTSINEKPVTFIPKKIGVIEFENQVSRYVLGGAAADAITASLLQVNSADVLDRAYLSKEFIQNGITRTKGIIDPVMVSTAGAGLGLDYVIMGNVIEAKSSSTPAHWVQVRMGRMSVPQFVPGYSSSNTKIDMMLVDVKTAKIVFTEKIYGSSATASVLDALLDAGRTGVRHIYKLIPLKGVVTKVEGDKIFINLGKENKIYVKNKFVVEDRFSEKGDGKEALRLEVVQVNETDCVVVVQGNSGIVKVGDIVTRSI